MLLKGSHSLSTDISTVVTSHPPETESSEQDSDSGNTRREGAYSLKLSVGEIVEVRSKEEILATLDEKGTLDSLPFMPEMLRYCGGLFRVAKRADKTCDTIEKSGLRRMTNTVHLENLRCDGACHGDCQANCLLFWKEAWLERAKPGLVEVKLLTPLKRKPGNRRFACDEATLMRATRQNWGDPSDVKYSCQTTELRKASSPLPAWDLRQYIRDIRSGQITVGGAIRGLMIVMLLQITWIRGGYRIGTGLARLLGFPVLEGKLTKTPAESQGLQPGELVEIKSKREIEATLDRHNRNRGLSFDPEMAVYCGGRYRVLKRVEHIIDEQTGRMRKIPNDCVILEGVTCRAYFHRFCPRGICPYWREIWLHRVDEVSY